MNNIKNIKLKIHQGLFQNLLDTAIIDPECRALERLILIQLRKSMNNMFFIKQDMIIVHLKPFEALALSLYIQAKNRQDAQWEYYEMIDYLLRNSIIKEQELLAYK